MATIDKIFSIFLVIANTQLLNSSVHSFTVTSKPLRNDVDQKHNQKYILYWTSYKLAPFYFWGEGQGNLINKKCPVTNCYMTTDRNYFGGDLTKFDAIAFNGCNMVARDMPSNRSEHQKYIYVNLESSTRFPTCEPVFDGFYNWTSTYKLDSDIPYPYVLIKNKYTDEIVGPKVNMQWAELTDLDDNFSNKLLNKTKLVAWYVSNCRTPSKREVYVNQLETAVVTYGYTVDIYGRCGSLVCPTTNKTYCDSKLSKDYYFYLAFENSLDEDYVTEKLIRALNNDVVPIVYGGANYSRFLPPGSYIDAREHTPTELASLLHEIVQSPQRYRNFFKWKNMYKYSNPLSSVNICKICAALNDQDKVKTKTVHNNLREWWLGRNFKNRCHLK